MRLYLEWLDACQRAVGAALVVFSCVFFTATQRTCIAQSSSATDLGLTPRLVTLDKPDHEEVIEIGNIRYGESHRVELNIVNNLEGASDLHIDNVKSSCGCLAGIPRDSLVRYSAEGDGNRFVLIAKPKKPGIYQSTILYTFKEFPLRPLAITLKGTALPRFTFSTTVFEYSQKQPIVDLEVTDNFPVALPDHPFEMRIPTMENVEVQLLLTEQHKSKFRLTFSEDVDSSRRKQVLVQIRRKAEDWLESTIEFVNLDVLEVKPSVLLLKYTSDSVSCSVVLGLSKGQKTAEIGSGVGYSVSLTDERGNEIPGTLKIEKTIRNYVFLTAIFPREAVESRLEGGSDYTALWRDTDGVVVKRSPVIAD